MAFDQEVVADVDFINYRLLALTSLLFGEQQALVLKSFACPFL